VLVVAAAYELTPLKDVCLGKCRSPLGFLLGSWRDGLAGSLEMGAKHGAWCVGCCWALMAALFALGVMSIAWMAFVGVLIAAEKTLPWARVVTRGTAALLLALGVLLMAAPAVIPWLTIPGSGGGSGMMMGWRAASCASTTTAHRPRLRRDECCRRPRAGGGQSGWGVTYHAGSRNNDSRVVDARSTAPNTPPTFCASSPWAAASKGPCDGASEST
jgi:hypothetical protein